MGRKRSRANENTPASWFTQQELVDLFWRYTKAAHQGIVYRSQNLDAFAPRQHIGKGWYQITKEDSLLDPETLYIRATYMSQNLDHKLDLPPAFPSSPTRLPRFSFYFYDERHHFLGAHNFYSLYAAARFVNTIIDNQPYKWASDQEIEIDNGVTIKADHFTDMEKVIEHKDNATEAKWELPMPYTYFARRIIAKSPLDKVVAQAIDTANNTMSGHPLGSDADNAAHRRSGAQIPKTSPKSAPARSHARPARSGDVTTLANIAQTLSLDPRKCRQFLRKSPHVKPATGWEWSNNDEIATITKWLKENVK